MSNTRHATRKTDLYSNSNVEEKLRVPSEAALRSAVRLLCHKWTVHAILDTLAHICAEEAELIEAVDPKRAALWDAACGKVAIAANKLAN